jgi:hypothetical protein
MVVIVTSGPGKGNATTVESADAHHQGHILGRGRDPVGAISLDVTFIRGY